MNFISFHHAAAPFISQLVVARMTRYVDYLLWPYLLSVLLLFARGDDDTHLTKSIDCGSREAQYTDSYGLTWENDDGMKTGNVANLLLTGTTLHRSLRTLRYFPKLKKNCYVISGPFSQKHLVRASFYYGNYDGKGKPPKFKLHFDANDWDEVVTSGEDVVVKEVIYNVRGANITLCLGRMSDDQTPFISSIEVRSLDSKMYNTSLDPNDALIYIARTAFGANHTIRYPDDVYDRMWNRYQLPTQGEDLVFVSNEDVDSIDTSRTDDLPPPQALAHAVTRSSISSTTLTLPSPIQSVVPITVYFNVYYLEISAAIGKTTQRYFKFTVDGVQDGTNTFSPVSTRPSRSHRSNANLSASSAFSWENVESAILPPIVNAWEFFAVRHVMAGTDNTDVTGLKILQNSYEDQLGAWVGDPCLPPGFHWEWVQCSNADPPRVTALHLRGFGLNGTLPDFSLLDALEIIDLSNNSLNGDIPDFLGRAFSQLKELNLANNNFTGIPPPSLQGHKSFNYNLSGNNLNNLNPPPMARKSNAGMIVGICIGVVVFLALLAFIVYRSLSRQASSPQKSGPRSFSFSELQEATQDFRSERFIGEGGFGRVYMGILKDGTQVAVKRRYIRSGHDLEQFQAEIDTLSKVSHDFLVKLIGYCQTKDELFLVYEYMVNGTLASYLYGSDLPILSWEQRLTICIQAASGVSYLHTGFSKGIIHGDVKTSNILVDEKFTAKVSDFGLSRIGPDLDRSHVTTTVEGTWGYLDPEYFTSKKLTEKSDVYSFGMVLLEVLCARPSNEQLQSWAINCQRNGKLEEIIDPRIVGTINPESLAKFWETIEQCIEESAINRPTMAWVLSNLRRALDLQPKPVHHAATMYHDQRSDLFQDACEASLMKEFVGEINQANQKSTTSTNSAISETNSAKPEGR